MNRNRMIFLNVIIVTLTSIINIVLGLVEIKFFLERYGADINGLIQTGNQALGYLSLLEGGLCSAYTYHMYKCKADNDNNKLSQYYKGLKHNVSRAVLIMIAVAILISMIYPLFLNREDMSYIFMCSVFILLSVKTILPYQITLVPMNMIILNEERYKVELIQGVSRTVIYVFEILLLLYTSAPIQLLLVGDIIIALLIGLLFVNVMNGIYRDVIIKDVSADVSPRGMTKDVIPHTISGLIFNSTDNVIISIFDSLSDVTVYSNYNLISTHAITLTTKFVEGATATLGIKIAKKDESAYQIFREIFAGILFVASVASSVYIIMINDFISLWIGDEFCTNTVNVILFGAILLCGLVLPSLQSLVAASGTFKESKGFIMAQAVVNLILTLALVPRFGIMGALIGTVVARVCITVPCNYLVLYRKVFTTHNTKWIELPLLVAVTAVICIANRLILRCISFDDGWMGFVFKLALSVIIAVAISSVYYWSTDKSFRKLLMRLKPL